MYGIDEDNWKDIQRILANSPNFSNLDELNPYDIDGLAPYLAEATMRTKIINALNGDPDALQEVVNGLRRYLPASTPAAPAQTPPANTSKSPTLTVPPQTKPQTQGTPSTYDFISKGWKQ